MGWKSFGKKVRKESAKYEFGRNVKIPPTPAIIPSTTRDTSVSDVCIVNRKFLTPSEKASSPISSQPFKKSPKANVSKNTTAIITKKIGTPQTEWVKYLSTLSVDCIFSSFRNKVSSIISSIYLYFWAIISFS